MTRCQPIFIVGAFLLLQFASGAMEEIMPMAGGDFGSGAPNLMKTQVTLKWTPAEPGRSDIVAKRVEQPSFIDIPGLVEPEVLAMDRYTPAVDPGMMLRPPVAAPSFPPAELYIPYSLEPETALIPSTEALPPARLATPVNSSYDAGSAWSSVLPSDAGTPSIAALDSPSLPMPVLPVMDASTWLGDRDRSGGVRRLGMK